MVNKNLFSLATIVSLSVATFFTHNSPVRGATAKLQKSPNSPIKVTQNIKREKPNIISNLLKNRKLNKTENYQNSLENLNSIQTESVQIARSAGSGKASWYGPGFHGRLTANGERYNQNALTAAHRSLPFGTRVRVTNLNNGRSVVVRINDRGPFIGGRIIDLSAAAAHNLGMVHHGVVPVNIQVLN